MLRFIFRKNKSNKERLWSSPKDTPVLQSHRPLLEEEGKAEGLGGVEGLPPSPGTSRHEEPSYVSLDETAGGELPHAEACQQVPCSTFFSPEAGAGTAEWPGPGKRTSIVLVETDAVLALDPQPLYATVQKVSRPGDKPQSPGVSPHGPDEPADTAQSAAVTRKNTNPTTSEETPNMSATPPAGDEDAGHADRPRPESGFDFTISLMEELLANFQTFEDLALPELDGLGFSVTPPRVSPIAVRDPDNVRLSQILTDFEPEVVNSNPGDVSERADDNLTQPDAWPPRLNSVNDIPKHLPSPPILRKTVTFNDDVQKFERPQSLITESDGVPDDTMVKVPAMESDIVECPLTDAVKPPNGGPPNYLSTRHQNGIVASKPPRLPPDNTSLDCLSVASDDDVYSDEERDATRRPVVVKKLRGLRITLLVFAWVLMGLGCEVSDPALRYYSEGLNITYEQTARAYAAEGGGILGGALLTGAALSYCPGYPDAALAVSLLVGASSLMSRPWARSLLYLGCNLGAMGVSRGVLLVGGTIYGVRIQEENKCTVLLYLLYTFYNLGALSSCQLVFIITNVEIPAKVHVLLDLLGYPSASRAGPEAASEVFPWSASGILLGLIVATMYVIVSVGFLALSGYAATQHRKRKRREGEIAKRGRDKLKKGIKMVGSIEDTDPSTSSGTTGRSPLLGNRGDDSDSDSGYNKKPAGTPGSMGSRALGNGAALHCIADKTPNGILARRPDGRLSETGAKGHGDTSNASARNKMKTSSQGKAGGGKTVTFLVKPKREPVRWFQGGRSFDVPLLMYLYVFFTLAAGAEAVMGRYLYEVIAVAEGQISQKEATCIMIAYWGASAVSRMMSLPVSRGLTPNVIMITCLTLGIVGPVVLGIYGKRYHVIIWLFSAVTGFAYGPILPGGLTFANIYLNLVPKTVALAFVMAGIGVALCVWLGGLILDYFGCQALMYFSTGMACLSALLYVPVLLALAARRPGKVKTPKTEEKAVTRQPAVTYL